ncbi:Response regulator receiver domain-containing protein [Streptomyces sp. PAN_FS17]|nr:Response regulator receiver domain-containing protein [Streptomyces sp. PAN_FS17]
MIAVTALAGPPADTLWATSLRRWNALCWVLFAMMAVGLATMDGPAGSRCTALALLGSVVLCYAVLDRFPDNPAIRPHVYLSVLAVALGGLAYLRSNYAGLLQLDDEPRPFRTLIAARFPRTRVLILTTYDTDTEIERGVEAGAIGYLLKDTTREQLVDAIHAAARGETVLAPRVAERLVARMRQPAQALLTAREADVLNAVADGLTNAEIGRRLVIAEATVKTHLLRLFAKLDVNDRTRAVVVAMERGLLRRASGTEGSR